MVQHKSSDIRVGSVKLECHYVDLLSHLVVLPTQVHLQLVNIVRYSFVSPRTNFEGIVSLEVYAANTSLAEHNGEWELILVIKRNESHRDAILLSWRHIELNDCIRLLPVY